MSTANLLLTNIEMRSLINSAVISLGVSFLTLALSFFLGLPLAFFKIPGKRLLPFLFLIPLLIPPYLHAFSWMHFLMSLGDYKIFGLSSGYAIQLLNSIPGVIFVLTAAYFPISFFIIYQAVSNFPQQLIDAAGQITSPAKVIRRIIIPAILPQVLTAATVTFIVTFITFDVPAFLGKNIFVTQIFKSFTFTGEFGRALYLSSIPVLIIGSIWALLFIILVKDRPFFSFQSLKKKGVFLLEKPPAFIIFFFYLMVVLCLLSSILPLAVLQVKNILLEKTPFYTASSSGVIANTLWISVISSFFIVLLSTFAFLFFYRKMLGRILFLSLLILPSITFAILFIFLFNRPFLNLIYTTPIILVIAYSFRFAPLVTELLHSYSQQINPQYIESGRLLYPISRRMLNMIILPLYTPVLFLAWIFSFWLVATELPFTLLVQPPGFQTIITRLFIVLHYGAEELMGSMTLALLSVSFFPILVAYFFFRKNLKNDQ